MKKLILMAAVMLSVLPAAAQEQASKFDASYIQVWGQAEKEITPDEFYLSVTINEKDSKGIFFYIRFQEQKTIFL